MKAAIGDWLRVNSHSADRHARQAQILAVGADGGPPYTVQWVDDDRTVIVYPGPDAEVVTAQRLAELDRLQTERISSVQSTIRAERETPTRSR